MAKLQIRMHPKPKRAGAKTAGVSLKRVKTASGKVLTVRAVQANSPTFAEDFLAVFTENVRRARKANKSKSATATRAAKQA